MINNCPWQNFPPDRVITYCERPVCGWVRYPANDWSNLAFVIVGIIIILLTIKRKQQYLNLFGWIVIVLSLGSFALHSTGTHWGAIIDNVGMGLVIVFVLITNLWRVYRLEKRQMAAIFGLVIAILVTLLIINSAWGPGLLTVSFGFALVLEFVIWKREKSHQDKSNLLAVVILMLGALVSYVFDVARIGCVPDNHIIQGVALWHLFSAIMLFFLYRYFSQFEMPE